MSKTATLTISYGYDIHSVELDRSLYEAFANGDVVELDGQGFSYEEEGWQQDHWILDGKTGEIAVQLANCAEFIAQDHWIDVEDA